MERSEALAIVEPQLNKARFEHTIRVTDTALELAKKYGGKLKTVELAAIFHDYAKYRNRAEMQRWIETEPLPKDLLDYHHELWHGPVGALLVKREAGIENEDVLSAIRWHTTGRAAMSHIEKLVFLADYIEPGRDFPGVDQVRDAAKQDLDFACWMVSKNTITYLISKNQRIYPDTFHAYNDLTKVMEDTKWREEING
ncbi:bis(5'-nucleosyl)-tetraphosphatase (symmetrical) YqeK [Sediminibacillus albus]|uniref:bis(5'-nucleosyl)-tetraphosphatase (symmetrical) n=1 Tax=Sediminibacillus albus TaxID=407036 RepID=A0A1G9CML2_9BACI|nr:bis(5'-nucleosyl)-tetraphosphatase (symmetrical) YqeK [Sediminibacillus albus]SDK52862.1 putative HD superfamily hydrolase of NAD metabolism [Sediminibacillus albus]